MKGNPAQTSTTHRSRTVLIVEDETVLRRLFRQTLQEGGYNVLDAPDGQAALELCEQTNRTIDVAVTDVVMPRMSGPEFAARLVSLHPDIKVIYISGYADEKSVSQWTPEAETDYLQKPFGPDTLLDKVHEVLGSRRKAA